MQREIIELSRADIDGFLKSQKVGVLSLAAGEAPYGVPLAYSYDGEAVYLTLGPQGRKMECLGANKNVCFTVFWMPDDFGMQDMTWTSVICDGDLEHLTVTEEIKKAVRAGEQQMELPEGAWDSMLQRFSERPEHSPFWRINIKTIAGKKS